MKIVILGGGPGGLYSGLLLKKANPAHDITVLERNPPDATFGWGIVFSDRTLASLREAVCSSITLRHRSTHDFFTVNIATPEVVDPARQVWRDFWRNVFNSFHTTGTPVESFVNS